MWEPGEKGPPLRGRAPEGLGLQKQSLLKTQGLFKEELKTFKEID